MTDDHAVSALGAYGSRLMETPNLDRIAQEGMRFYNCFVTNALCAPSRATILTGKYSHLHGVRENFNAGEPGFDGSQQTFPKLLQQVGYRTMMIGKWHLRSDPTGFDYWNVLPGQGSYNNPDLIEMGTRRSHSGYVTDIITDLAIEAIEDTGAEPFMLFLGHKAPHRGWVPDPEHDDLFDDRDLPLPETFWDDYTGRASAAAHADMRIAEMPDYSAPITYSPEEAQAHKYQQYVKDYLGTIASVDKNTGRLLDYLDEAGLAENTIIIYTSDNGFFVGEHGWFDKRFMYEESIRIPLLVRYPGVIPAGSASDDIVLNLDFAQTILDFAGAETPQDMQGRSFRPTLEGRPPYDWRRSMYYHYYEYPRPHRVLPHYGVRDRRYKLIHYYTTREWELFDLKEDPHEMRNVAHDSDYASVRRQLGQDLERLQAYYEDPVATSSESRQLMPGFSLAPAFPNPFQQAARLDLELDRAGHVRGEVFDLLGRSVDVVLDEYLPAGRRELVWEPDDWVPAGVYFFRVTRDGVTLTRRLYRAR